MFHLNTENGDIHFADGFVLPAPYDSPRYQEYAAFVQAGNAPDEFVASVKASIPQSVTMRQARLALLASGLLPSVDAAIGSMLSPQKEAALIEWEYSQVIERDYPFVMLLGQAMGLNGTALDNLFALASTL